MVLRQQIARLPYTPADRVWLATLSRLLPRRRLGEVFLRRTRSRHLNKAGQPLIQPAFRQRNCAHRPTLPL
jgi:hypothetical protein